MTTEEVRQRLAGLGFHANRVKALTGSFDKQIYLIDDALVLRPSSRPMSKEQESFGRIASLSHVPKVRAVGIWPTDPETHYTLLDQLPGKDFIDVVGTMSPQQSQELGARVALFLNTLHALRGPAYDVGHYLPLVPQFTGTWQEGHRAYGALLRDQAQALTLSKEGALEVEASLAFLESELGVLETMHGPVLLHNDFHPKNIIVDQGRFSGVIDWECSQYGEADFELVHLIHWCLYPPVPGADFRPFLAALWASDALCLRYPHLARRLTVYEIEHELIQLIWSQGKAEADRVAKLRAWRNGGVQSLLNTLGGNL